MAFLIGVSNMAFLIGVSNIPFFESNTGVAFESNILVFELSIKYGFDLFLNEYRIWPCLYFFYA